MRTTLTIDPDVWEQLQRRRRQRGRSLKAEVNDLLRAGLLLEAGPSRVREEPFVTPTFDVGRPALDNLDDVQSVLEFADGPWRR